MRHPEKAASRTQNQSRKARRTKAAAPASAGLFDLQPLEERLLFSANGPGGADLALPDSAIKAINSGLAEFVEFTAALDQYGDLGKDLTGVGKSLGDLFDLGGSKAKPGFLDAEFAKPLSDFFKTADLTADKVSTFLAGLSASADSVFSSIGVTGISGGYFAATNEFEWELTLSGTRSTQFSLDPGAALGDAGVSFTAPDVSIDTSAAFKFSFGVKADGTGFFVTIGGLDLSAKVDTGDTLDFAVKLDGSSGYGIKGGQVSLDAAITGLNVNVTKDAQGRIGAAGLVELTNGLSASEITYGSATASLDAVLPVDLIGTGFPTIFITSENLLLGEAPDVELKYYLTDATLQAEIISLLGALDSSVGSITSEAMLSQRLPIINKTLAELLPDADFETMLSFQNVAQNYFDSTAEPELPGLVTALSNHFASITSLAGAGISGLFDAATKQIEFSFDLSSTLSETLVISELGDAGTELGLKMSDSISLEVTGALTAQFTLGVDLSKATLSADDFYLKVTDLSVSAGVNTENLDFGVNIGPLSAGVQDGSVKLEVKGSVVFADPNDDGRISISELGLDSVEIVPSGDLEIMLPLAISFGGYDFKDAGVSPYLRIFSDNPLVEFPKADVSTPNFSRLFNLGKMGPEQVLDLMISAGDWAAQFRDAAVFDIQIPFLNNVDLGDAFDFGLLFSKNLRDRLSINDISIFATPATVTLASATNFFLSIEGNEAASKAVTVAAGTYSTPTQYAAALNAALSAAYSGDAPVEAVVNAGSDRELGTSDDKVQIRAKEGRADSFAIVAPFATLSALGIYQGATIPTATAQNGAPANGKLTADAVLTVSVDGGAPKTVTINRTSTETNTSIADLVADIQGAFTAAGITTITVSSSGGKLVFTGTGATQSFLIGGEGNSAWAELGLAISTTGGIGSVGSVQQTGAKFATFQELVPLLASALGIPQGLIAANYDPATETIKLHVEFGYNPSPLQLPVSFDLDMGDLGGVKTVDSSGNAAPLYLTLTPKLNAKLDFGYSFRPNIVDESLNVTAGDGYVSPAGYDQNADTPTPLTWNGRLSDNAVFTIILDDGVVRTLTIPKANTDNNTSVADLVADINAVIASTAGLNGKVVASVLPASGETAERVQFSTVAGKSRSLQIKTTSTNVAATELGFGADTFAQGSDQSITVTGLSTKTVDVTPDADAVFYISIDGGELKTITIPKSATDGNQNIGDLLADVNSAIAAAGLGSQLVATRFAAADRIQLSTIGNVRTLRFSADADNAAVTKLGFSDQEVFLRQRGGGFFIENAEIAASATIAVEDLRLAAQFGFLGLNTGDSGGQITLGLKAELKDAKSNTRFEIGSLFKTLAQGGIGSIAKVTPSGSADFALNNVTVRAGYFTVPGSATIGFVIDDLFPSDGLKITPILTGLPSIENFKKLDFTAIFNAVKQGVDVLSNYSEFSFLNNKIPVINLSAVEILDYADKFRLAIEELQENPAAALEFVESKIEEILGLPPNLVTLSIDGPNHDIVKISFTLEKTYNDSFALDLDLQDLGSLFSGGMPAGLDTITSLIDASAQGDMEVAAYAEAKLEIGIDLSSLTNPTPFLYDTSGLEFGIRLAGQRLNFNANIGIVGLAIVDGTVIFDSDGVLDANDDGVIDDDYATIRIGLKDNAEPGSPNDGRHYFTESFSFSDDFEVAFNGQFHAELPAALITPIGNIDLGDAIQLSTSTAQFANLMTRAAGTFPITITAPNIKDVLPEMPGLIQLLRDPSILLDGVDGALYKIQTALDSQTSQKLPLIGDRLAEGAQVIEDFREGFLASLTNKLRGAGDRLLDELRETMFEFFNDKIGLLADYDGVAGLTVDDIVMTFRKADGSLWVEGEDAPSLQDAVQFGLHLGKSYTADIPDLQLDFSLPGLALEINGSPSVGISWDFYFGFGVSISDLFFLDTEPTTDGLPKHEGNEYVENELEVNFDVKLTSNEASPFSAMGQLFFLQLQAKDAKLNAANQDDPDGKYSYFNGKFAVGLQDPGVGANQDGRLTFSELFKKGTTPVMKASLSAVADINLELDLSVQGSKVLPRIVADFNLDWAWTAGQPTQAPKVGFNNVGLDLGSFISDFLGPIAKQINDAIKPFDPVLDALQTRIPVLSDLMGRNYTLLDLAATFGKVDRRFVDAVLQVRALVADIAAAAESGENIIIPMGSIADLGSSVMKKGGVTGIDPIKQGISSAMSSIPSGATSQTKAVMSKATSVTGGGFGFPILKPSNVFKLLMGQDVVLFTYDVPRLEVSMGMSAKFSIFGPLIATFSGKISAFADIAVGFDTVGLNKFKMSGDPLDILDGFYISDRANPDGTGADVPEAGFSGRIDIGGAVNLAVVEAGISGFFQITANLDLNDPNDDGRIRGSEIISLLTYQAPNGNYYGPLNLGSITLKGEVGARAYVDVFAIFSWANVWEYEFFRATIFETTFTAPRPVPQLGKVGAGGVLTLNSGSGAGGRVFGSTTDVGEDYTLVSLPNGSIEVTFNNTGTKQVFSGVNKVVIDAGKGNDRVDASKLNVFVEIYGGEGDDVLIAGTKGGILDGGAGNDELYGGDGVDILLGGTGSDILHGGRGDDILDGGDGRDELMGGEGRDTYRFSNNWGADVLELLGHSDPSNQDVLDFSRVTDALTISIGSNLSKVSAGKNSLNAADSVGEISEIHAGAGSDTININSTSLSGIKLGGGGGSDNFIVGLGRLLGPVTITDDGNGVGDSDTVVAAPIGTAPISVFDNKLTSFKGAAGTEVVNFDGGIENLTIDAARSVVSVEEAIDMTGSVRFKALTAQIPNPISASYIRVESINEIDIAADLNSRRNGNLEVIVSKGDLNINANILSSAGELGATGDGSGVVQLISRGGQILADGTGTVRAAEGLLLLLGSTGSIGTEAQPIPTQVKIIAASTNGAGVINIHEEDGVVIDEVAIIRGLTSQGGDLLITNFGNELRFEKSSNANGGNMNFTSDQIQINAELQSTGADVHLQPLNPNTTIGLGDDAKGTFDLDTTELANLVDGFGAVVIGRDNGTHNIEISDIKVTDPTYIQNPIIGGRIYQTGAIVGVGNASLTIQGSGHTIEIADQIIPAGNIDIIDSAIVREGESVRLETLTGNININFDVDGTLGGAGETLTLNAPGGHIVIKGDIGSAAALQNLIIENALSVRFEGSVNVGMLSLMNVGSVTIDGAITADTVSLGTVGNADFRSTINAQVITKAPGTLGSVTFQGAITAQSIDLTATTLLDFYQGVTTSGNINVTTTGLLGDITFRQQVTAGGDITLSSQDAITFVGGVKADDLTVSAAHDVSFQGPVEIAGTLLQLSGTGATSFTSVTAGSIDLTATSFAISGNIIGTNALGRVKLEATTGGVTVGGATVAANSFEILAAGNASFSGSVTAASIEIDAANISYNALTTTGGNATLIAATNGTITGSGAAAIAGNYAITRALNVALGGITNVAGNFSVVAGAAINLANTTTAANISLTAANTITFGTGGVYTTTGGITLVTTAAGSGNGVTANGPIGSEQALAITTVRGVALNAAVEAGSVTIDAATISYSSLATTNNGSATLTAASNGSITATGETTIGGDYAITRALNVALGGMTTVAGEFTAVAAGSINLANTTTAAEITLEAVTISYNSLATTNNGSATLTAAANGTVTGTGATIITGDYAITRALNITLGGITTVSGEFTAVAGGAINLANTTTAADITLTAANTITFGTGGVVATTGGITLVTTATGAGNGVTANGPITAEQALQINTARGAALNATVDAGSISVDALNIRYGSLQTHDGGSATLTAGAAGTIEASGTTTVEGDFTIVRALNVVLSDLITVTGTFLQGETLGFSPGTTTLAEVKAGAVSLAVNTLTLNGAVTATSGDVLLKAGLTSSISALSTITALTGDLRVQQAGSVTLSSTVQVANAHINAVQSITVANNASFITSGDAEFTTTSATVGEIRFTGALSIAGDITVNSARDLSFLGAVTVNGDLTVASAAGVQYKGAVRVDGTLLQTTSVKGATTFESSVTAGDLDLWANSFVFSSSITVAGEATVSAAGSILVSGAATVAGKFSVIEAATLNLAGTVTAADIDLTAASTVTFGSGGVFATSGDIRVTTTAAGTGNGVTANGTVDAEDELIITSARGVALNGTVNAATISITGTTLALPNTVAATGDITLTAATTGNVTIGATITAGGILRVDQAKDVTFVGLVTAESLYVGYPLTGTGSISTITINASGVAVTGDIRLKSTSTGVGNGVTASGPLATGTDGSLVIESLRAVNLSGAIDAGDINIDGSAIAFGSTVEALTFITLTATSGSITAAADVVAGGLVTVDGAVGVTFTGKLNAGDLAISNAATVSLGNRVSVIGAATITISGDLVAVSEVSVGGLLNVVQARDASFNGAVLAGSVDVGDLTVRTITFGAGVTTTAGAIELEATTGGVFVTGTTNAFTALRVLNGAALAFTGLVTAQEISLHGGTLTTSSDVTSRTGSTTITVTGDVSIGGETKAAGPLSVTGSRDVTFTGAVQASTITVDVRAITAGGTFVALVGDVLLTTDGNIAVTGAIKAGQDIRVTKAQEVTFQGAVTAQSITIDAASLLAGNTVTTSVGDLSLLLTGNIRVVGLTTINGDLLIRGALNTAFQGQAQVVGDLIQIDGGGNTRFEGVTRAATISVRAAQQVFAGSTIQALSGNLFIESDEIDFAGGTGTVQGVAKLILRPYAAGTSIDIGSPTPSGTLDLSDIDLSALRDGFAEIIIGRAEDASGAMVIGSSIFKDNVTLHAGSITLENNVLPGQIVSVLGSVDMTARTGNIITNDDIESTDLTMVARDNIVINSNVLGTQFVNAQAGSDGTGTIIVTNIGQVRSTATASTTWLTAGASGGSIEIAGRISAVENVTLTAASGLITQTSGNTAAADILALAQSGITLLTTADHISARVTATGDMKITDTNPDFSHFVNLGSRTDVNDGLFTADGNITFISDANANAYRVIANGAVNMSVAGDIFVDAVEGSAISITGTILLDADRTTNGEDIEFAGNIRLLRDITLSSGGGNIIITGRVLGTAGEDVSLTLNAGSGNIYIGGPIGTGIPGAVPLESLTVVSANSVTFGDEETNLAAIQVRGNIEINANAVEFNSPAYSVVSLDGKELILRPLQGNAAIDIGTPATSTATFALGDDDLLALGDGFSSITIGQAGGEHDVRIESARFRDSLVLNADRVALLESGKLQGITGLSVVNGSDDNSITINARSLFTQGKGAALTAGRFGDITITADQVELDERNRNLIRGFGDLIIQPFSSTQAISIGSAGTDTDFDLNSRELAAIGQGFENIIFGREDGSHAITIGSSITFRDSVVFRAPVGEGSIQVGDSTGAVVVKTASRGDNLTFMAGGDIVIDASLQAIGSGSIGIYADADASGSGSLLVGQNIAGKKVPALTLSTQSGSLILQGENVTVGKVDATNAKIGAVNLRADRGNIQITSDLNADRTGAFTMVHKKSTLASNGSLFIGTTGLQTGAVEISGVKVSARQGLQIHASENVLFGASTILKNVGNVLINSARNVTLSTGTQIVSTGSIAILGDRTNGISDGNSGLISIESKVKLTAKSSLNVAAYQVSQASGSLLKSPNTTVEQG